MSSNENSSPIRDRELLEWLDALRQGHDKVRAAAQLARLGVWARGSILPRGTLWAAAKNALPQPDGIRTLVSVLLDDSNPEAQTQAASALGEWGGVEAIAPLAAGLASSNDDVRDHCIGALGTVGGPEATKSLLVALLQTDRSSDALSILDAVEELLIGGKADATDAPLVTVEPPKEFEYTFKTMLDEIRGTLVRFVEAASRNTRMETAASKARSLLDFLARAHDTTGTASLSRSQLDTLLAEIDRLPSARVGACLSEEELADYVMDDVDDATRARIEAHIGSCSTCLEKVERTLEGQQDREPTRSVSPRGSIAAKDVLQEAVALLKSAQFDSSRGVHLEGANAAVSVDVTTRDQRTRVAVQCQARSDVEVNWASIGLRLIAANGDVMPPFLDASGRRDFEIDRSLAEPFRLDASSFGVVLDVPQTIGRAAQWASATPELPTSVEERPPHELTGTTSASSVSVEVVQHPGGTLEVRIQTADPSFQHGAARLEFRGATGVPLTFKTVMGEPVPITVRINLEEEGIFYGQWMAEVNVPEAATLHVVVFPGRA